MPKAKYESIYLQIRKDITSGKYEFGDYLPSENEYAERFDCTRNTVRRALSMLTGEGFLQPRHGRGVQVIYRYLEDELHNFWRMDTRDFSHERKCAIAPFSSNIHSHFCLFCVIIILRRQRTDAAGTDH